MLVLGLLLVALVPNLILGGLIWLDVINTPWSKHVTAAPYERSAPTIRLATLPVLTSPALLEATAGEQVSFPIALDGTDGVPARSIIRSGRYLDGRDGRNVQRRGEPLIEKTTRPASAHSI